MYITPDPLYRLTIKGIGCYLFGPVGDQRNHLFFDVFRSSGIAVIRRRTRWLRSRDFSASFTEVTIPANVWLGQKDRLVNINEQRKFFTNLANNQTNYKLSLIEGSGHVVLSSDIIKTVQKELLEWSVQE